MAAVKSPAKSPAAKSPTKSPAESAAKHPTKSPATSGKPAVAAKTFQCTELANAEQLIARFGADLRYIPAWNKWLAWDGKRWCENPSAAPRFAVECLRIMAAEAVRAAKGTKSDEARKTADAFVKHCARSQSASGVRGMLMLASSDPTVAVLSLDALNGDRMKLNVKNGTIDLRTGKLEKHRPDDLITKIAEVAYDPEAKSKRWDRFLLDVTAGDKDLVSYLQRIVGYALTGDIRERALFFFWGEGANGKSTFLNLFQTLLGDYAVRGARGLLFRQRSDRHPTSIATLHGRRFVVIPEIGEGDIVDVPLVKDLTGGDQINARRMREDEWDFVPTHKLFIAGNHRPRVTETDHGIWDRLRLIPWTVRFTKPDKRLPERLRKDLPAVLAWAVQGCLEWQRGGLGEPPAVIKATSEYREQQDVLGQFFREACIFDPGFRISRQRLINAYHQWSSEQGFEYTVGPHRFGAALAHRKVVPCTVRLTNGETTRGWAGVMLRKDKGRQPAERADLRLVEAPSKS